MKYRVWECKIVVRGDVALPTGFDAPPRSAAERAVEKADIEVLACFSGWDGKIGKMERVIVDNFVEEYNNDSSDHHSSGR